MSHVTIANNTRGNIVLSQTNFDGLTACNSSRVWLKDSFVVGGSSLLVGGGLRIRFHSSPGISKGLPVDCYCTTHITHTLLAVSNTIFSFNSASAMAGAAYYYTLS